MISINEQFVESLILNQIRLENYSTDVINKILKELKKGNNELLGMFTNKSINQNFIKEVRDVVRAVFKQTQDNLIKELNKYGTSQVNYLDDIFSLYFSDALTTKQNFKKVSDLAVRGIELTKTLKAMERGMVNQYIAIARVSFADGLSLDDSMELVQGLITKRDHNVETLFRTALATVSDNINKVSIANNQSLIKGVKLVVTLDTRTSTICQGYSNDNKLYPADNYPHPPFHFNCRTVAVPITKSWSDLGGKRRKIPVKFRSSMDGLVPRDLTYNRWLSRQTPKIQDEVLGKNKGKLYRKGKIKLNKYKPRG